MRPDTGLTDPGARTKPSRRAFYLPTYRSEVKSRVQIGCSGQRLYSAGAVVSRAAAPCAALDDRYINLALSRLDRFEMGAHSAIFFDLGDE